MSRLKQICIVALQGCLMIASEVTIAEDVNGRFAIKGIGAHSCSDFYALSKEDPESYRQFGGWMNGYITARNAYEPETFDIVNFEDSDTLIAYVLNYCKNNPDHRFVFAVRGIVEALRPTKISEQGHYVIFSGTGTIRLHRSTVLWIVQELAAQKLLPETSYIPEQDVIISALKAYQKRMGMTESGIPDQETLVRLLRRKGVGEEKGSVTIENH